MSKEESWIDEAEGVDCASEAYDVALIAVDDGLRELDRWIATRETIAALATLRTVREQIRAAKRITDLAESRTALQRERNENG